MSDVLREVADEMARQDAKWGIQDHPDGTGLPGDAVAAAVARTATNHAALQGRCTWRKILAEEVFEAFAETDPALLRAELVQVEAVCAQWRLAIDRRMQATAGPVGALPVADGSEVCGKPTLRGMPCVLPADHSEPNIHHAEGQERSEGEVRA